MPTILPSRNSATPKRSASVTCLSSILAPLFLLAEVVDGLTDVAFDDVIAQNDADLLAVGEVFGQAQRVGDAAFAFLISEIEVGEPELFAIGKQAEEIPGVAAPGHDEDIADTGIY